MYGEVHPASDRHGTTKPNSLISWQLEIGPRIAIILTMRNEESGNLLEFVEAAKVKGASDEFLASLLTRRGWPQEDVYSAIGHYWEHQTGLSVPERTSRGESSRDAFLYLLSFSTLATWTSALGSMLFQFIDHWLPDPVAQQIFNLRVTVTWQMASIAVAFPIFLFVMRTILRDAQPQSGVRKWLTYIALLLTAGAMICDLIWVFDYFLTGELTLRFALKALTVMLICAAVFFYYLDTKSVPTIARSVRFAMGATAVIAAALSVGLGVAGTPNTQRRIEADNRRVQDLRTIATAVHSWHQRTGKSQTLPPSLNSMVFPNTPAVDPESGQRYEYRVKTGTEYELCAVFDGTQETGQYFRSEFWHHEKGRACFALDAAVQPVW